MTGLSGAHNDLHSEQGARRREHVGRSPNPVIKVHDLAWLEFQKPDLVRAEAVAHAFGFATVLRTGDELQLRGTDPGGPCLIIRRGPRSRFVGTAFKAADEADVRKLAKASGAVARTLPDTIGGLAVDLVDPSGIPVHVVAGTHQLEALPPQAAHTLNFGTELRRTNAMQRPPRLASTRSSSAAWPAGRSPSSPPRRRCSPPCWPFSSTGHSPPGGAQPQTPRP